MSSRCLDCCKIAGKACSTSSGRAQVRELQSYSNLSEVAATGKLRPAKVSGTVIGSLPSTRLWKAFSGPMLCQTGGVEKLDLYAELPKHIR